MNKQIKEMQTCELSNIYFNISTLLMVQSVGTVEYTDWISAEG